MRNLAVLGLVACNAVVADVPKSPTIDPKADEILHKMTAAVAGAKRFTFDAEHILEAVTKDGQKLQFSAASRVAVERPDKVRSDRIGPVADVAFYYNGNQMSVFGKKSQLYATAAAPDNIDAAIDFARDELGLEAPAADLFYSDPYSALMDDVVSGAYIAKEPIGDHFCHHLAYRGHATDWQIWVEDSPRSLPCRYVITTKTAESPDFSVTFANWNLAPKLAASEFVFTPPKGATQIDFIRHHQAQAKQEKQEKKP